MNTLKQAVFLRCGDMRSYTDSPQVRLDSYWEGVGGLNWEAAHWRAIMPDNVQDIAVHTTAASAREGDISADSPSVPSDESLTPPSTDETPDKVPPATPLSDACSCVPIRLLCHGTTVFKQAQLIVPPHNASEGGGSWTAKHSRGVVAGGSQCSLLEAVQLVTKHRAVTEPGALHGVEGVSEHGTLLVQGVGAPHAAPVSGAYDTLAHPDGFLYIVAQETG